MSGESAELQVGKRFSVVGEFYAWDIDDAFAVLAAHFAALRDEGIDGAGDTAVVQMDIAPKDDPPLFRAKLS